MNKRLCYKDGTAFKCENEEELLWIQNKLIAKGYEWLCGGTDVKTWDEIEAINFMKVSFIKIGISHSVSGVPFMIYDLRDEAPPNRSLVEIERTYNVKEYMNMTMDREVGSKVIIDKEELYCNGKDDWYHLHNCVGYKRGKHE